LGESIVKKTSLLAGAASIAFAATFPAFAADMSAPPIYKAPVAAAPAPPAWFVEGRLGASFGQFDDLKFLNPVGTAFTLNQTSGNYIILNNTNRSATSWTGAGAVGYYFTNQIFGKVGYQYFGAFRANGFAAFPGGNFRQDLKTDAHGILVGLGGDFNLTDAVFVQPTAEVGVGFLRSTGQQGANLGVPDNFPAASRTNFIVGGGLGVGYHATRNFDVIASGNYYWLGRADTGATGNPAPGNMNPGEQLQAKLGVFTATVGGRFKF